MYNPKYIHLSAESKINIYISDWPFEFDDIFWSTSFKVYRIKGNHHWIKPMTWTSVLSRRGESSSWLDKKLQLQFSITAGHHLCVDHREQAMLLSWASSDAETNTLMPPLMARTKKEGVPIKRTNLPPVLDFCSVIKEEHLWFAF